MHLSITVYSVCWRRHNIKPVQHPCGQIPFLPRGEDQRDGSSASAGHLHFRTCNHNSHTTLWAASISVVNPDLALKNYPFFVGLGSHSKSIFDISICVLLSWHLFCVFHMKYAVMLNTFWCLMTILPSYAHYICYPPKLWQWSNKSDHWQSEPSLSSASPSSYHPLPVNCACAPDQACSLGTDWEQHDQLVNNFNIILGLNPELIHAQPWCSIVPALWYFNLACAHVMANLLVLLWCSI